MHDVAILHHILLAFDAELSGFLEEQALMTTLAGLIVVLMLIVQEIDRLFTMMKNVFGF